ncbi:MAG: sugar transferase [Eubacterium sp.]
MNRNKVDILKLAEFLINGLSYLISAIISYIILDSMHLLRNEAKIGKREFAIILLASFLLATFFSSNLKDITKRTKVDEILYSIRFNFSLSISMAVLMLISKNSMVESRYMFVLLFITGCIIMSLNHLIFRLYRLKLIDSNYIAIITTKKKAKYILRELQDEWEYKIRGIIITDEDMCGKKIYNSYVVANKDNYMDWIRSEALDEVVIYLDYEYTPKGISFKKNIEEMEAMGIRVHLNIPVLREFDEYKNGISNIGTIPMLTIADNFIDYRLLAVKRIIDIIGALIGFIISIPIILIVSVPLLMESPGSLIFKQKRVGLNGRCFYIYKLRSMYVDAEQRKQELMDKNEMNGLMFKMTDDPRITKVGKFIRKTSIDELPQFLNVLKGDMSLVGTRPPTVDEFKQYKSHHKKRLSMKPGITGMWQVSGRSDIQDFEEVVRLDCKYVDNWSLGLDIRILIKTVFVVLFGKGSK